MDTSMKSRPTDRPPPKHLLLPLWHSPSLAVIVQSAEGREAIAFTGAIARKV